MNVLSLFDGMSCGQQALERAGIKVDNYYASEIDKYAIQVTMANYPNTHQLGSVVDVDTTKLPKIDLLIGGSPCQSFSFAGCRKGMSTKDSQEVLTLEHYLKLKQEEYEFEGQSYLFWEYMRILTEIRATNPNVLFLLENVIMGDKWESVLSKAIGLKPIEINSALVSAQNRRRLYWTNIGLKSQGLFGYLYSGIEQPKDKRVLLKDILEQEVDEKYYLSNRDIEKIKNWKSQQNPLENIETNFRKNGCLTARGNSDMHSGMKLVIDNQILTTSKERKVYQLSQNNKSNGGTQPYQQDRIYDVDGISPDLQANLPSGSNMINTQRLRRLTPVECERLQTVKDNYTNHVSDSQRYKMLGNGWTVDVIAHIFSYIIN